MSERRFSIKLDINNIGPHYGDKKIAFNDEVESNKAVFFATNGTGKSFISRAFRLTAGEKQTLPADDLLTLGQSSGSLTFDIVRGAVTKALSVFVERGQTPTVKNETGLIFHVFNSDFVEENVKPRHFSPDGKIEGYILGKTQIDLSEERERESRLETEIGEINKAIADTVNEARQELRKQGVLPSTTEFGLIEKARLRGKERIGDVSSFDEIVAQMGILSKAPERLDDVQPPSLTVDPTVFDSVIALLQTQYPKTEWDEDFVSSLKANRLFVEEGLKLAGNAKICPFCKQPYGTDALTLIQDYKAYLANREAELSRQIEHCQKAVTTLITDLKTTSQATKTAIAEISALRRYFPSLAETELEIPDTSESELQEFTSLLKLLESKSNDLTIVSPTINASANTCKDIINNINAIVKRNAQTIKSVNTTKQDSNAERLRLRRNLCKAQYFKYQTELSPRFAEVDAKSSALRDLQASIVEKEQQVRVSKRVRVYETLTCLLNRFFAEKYSIDKDTFQIRFLGSSVGDKASNILSDGEKSIVAFCFYLASTHLLMEHEDDYNKLFFVIDDPISSMDFHYVYAVAQSLRDIKESFGITTHDRMWVFTHNMEFLSILVRNFIINRAYIMKPGIVEVLEHQFLMPYESHLKDIIDVADGQQQPSHTTANSIRHVIETVSRFEFPGRSIEKYIAGDSILSQDSCIYTLCQDLSHGGIRNQQPFSSDVLIAACKTVERFMKVNYEGQVSAIHGSASES